MTQKPIDERLAEEAIARHHAKDERGRGYYPPDVGIIRREVAAAVREAVEEFRREAYALIATSEFHSTEDKKIALRLVAQTARALLGEKK